MGKLMSQLKLVLLKAKRSLLLLSLTCKKTGATHTLLLTEATARIDCSYCRTMVAPADDGGKVSQRGMINNKLQWSLLSSVCIYLVLTRRESVSLMGQVNSRISKNEEATARNDVRITGLEKMENKLKAERAILRKGERNSVLFGQYQSYYLGAVDVFHRP